MSFYYQQGFHYALTVGFSYNLTHQSQTNSQIKYHGPIQVQTLGFPNQFEGLKVDKRLSKSPLSHGLHEGLDDPKAEPPALVLKEVHGGCEPTQDKEAALEPCP